MTDSAAATIEELHPTMRDRVCLVTGATSGIGRVAGMGATVLLIGRDRRRGDAALAEIRRMLRTLEFRQD